MDHIQNCRDRIQYLSLLQNGWHDGEGLAPSAVAIAAGNLLLTKTPEMADLYCIYPTDLGGLLFEFKTSNKDCSVEIYPDGHLDISIVMDNGYDDMGADLPAPDSEEFTSVFNSMVG